MGVFGDEGAGFEVGVEISEFDGDAAFVADAVEFLFDFDEDGGVEGGGAGVATDADFFFVEGFF